MSIDDIDDPKNSDKACWLEFNRWREVWSRKQPPPEADMDEHTVYQSLCWERWKAFEAGWYAHTIEGA